MSLAIKSSDRYRRDGLASWMRYMKEGKKTTSTLIKAYIFYRNYIPNIFSEADAIDKQKMHDYAALCGVDLGTIFENGLSSEENIRKGIRVSLNRKRSIPQTLLESALVTNEDIECDYRNTSVYSCSQYGLYASIVGVRVNYGITQQSDADALLKNLFDITVDIHGALNSVITVGKCAKSCHVKRTHVAKAIEEARKKVAIGNFRVALTLATKCTNILSADDSEVVMRNLINKCSDDARCDMLLSTAECLNALSSCECGNVTSWINELFDILLANMRLKKEHSNMCYLSDKLWPFVPYHKKATYATLIVNANNSNANDIYYTKEVEWFKRNIAYALIGNDTSTELLDAIAINHSLVNGTLAAISIIKNFHDANKPSTEFDYIVKKYSSLVSDPIDATKAIEVFGDSRVLTQDIYDTLLQTALKDRAAAYRALLAGVNASMSVTRDTVSKVRDHVKGSELLPDLMTLITLGGD
jgi:hypothetical protein